MARALLGATSYEEIGGLPSAMRMAKLSGFMGDGLINGLPAIARGEGPVRRVQAVQPEDEDVEEPDENQEQTLADIAGFITESSATLALSGDEEMKLAELATDEEPILAGV